jgi:hypothetical protein
MPFSSNSSDDNGNNSKEGLELLGILLQLV